MKLDEKTAQELAKCIVLRCFRNTELENIHAGKEPHSESGDYSDVYVVTPAGEIPWNDVSKISNEQMKELRKEVVNTTYSFLVKMDDEKFLQKSLELSMPFTHNWDMPQVIDKF